MRGERKSLAFLPPAAGFEGSGVNTHCFLEDVRLGVLRLDESLVITTTDSLASDRLAALVEPVARGRWSPEEQVAEMVGHCLARVAHFGETWFEIVRDREAAALVPMPPYTVTPVLTWVLQHVPPSERSRVGMRFAVLHRRDTWSVAMPAELGGPRGQARLMRDLGGTDSILPSFIEGPHMLSNDGSSFDFGHYRRHLESRAAVITRAWGWSGRGMWRELTLEFYEFHRMLRFARSIALVTEHIISAFNSLLTREGIAARIDLTGRPKVQDIDNALQAFERGDSSIKRVGEIINHRRHRPPDE